MSDVQINDHVVMNTIRFSGNGRDIVTLNVVTGAVIWADGIDVTAAQTAFSRSIAIGAEMAANIKETSDVRVENLLKTMLGSSSEKGYVTTQEIETIMKEQFTFDKLVGK